MIINKPLDWLLALEGAILNKYLLENIQFMLHDHLVEREIVIKWIKDSIIEPFEYINWIEKSSERAFFAKAPQRPDPSLNRWIKYHHLKGNIFELKYFSPHPALKVCEKIVEGFFKSFYEVHQNLQAKITFTIFGECTYSEKEMRKELLYLLRTGNSKIEVKKGPLQDGEDTLYVLSAQPDTIENMLQSGYVTLEYFND